MSRTDKTRPHRIKVAEVKDADPYGVKREGWVTWRPQFRCGHTCHCNYGWYEQEKSKDRRQRKAAARNWSKDYE